MTTPALKTFEGSGSSAWSPVAGAAVADGPRRRILHVVFSSRIAGSERYCIDLARRQAALGHDVHVAGSGRSAVRRVLGPGVTYHPLSMPWFRAARLRRLVARLGVEVCHGHLSGACKALGALRGRSRSVATLHVGYKPHQHARLDGLICVNRAQVNRISGYGGQVRVIPNWLPAGTGQPPAGALRAELGLSADAWLVGSVGRLHRSKGMDVLIAAFKAVAPADAALAVVGEGPQRAELERLRGGDPRIKLIGFRPDVEACLREFDLFVSPSREESFGLAILEAMSAGLPLVATAAEGPAEFLADQPVDLVAPGSVEALAEALAAAGRRRVPGVRARVEYDLSAFDPAARVGNVMEFYASLDRAEAGAR